MLLAEFTAYLRATKAQTTQDKYTQAAKAFLGYLEFTGQSLTHMKGNTIRQFVAWLITPEPGTVVPGPATIRLMVAGVRAYLDFLKGEDVPISEQARPNCPKLPQSLPLVMSRQQLSRYVQCTFSEPDPMATAMLIIPYCGLRVTEVCELRLRDVIWRDFGPDDRRYILHVEKGKGGKERLAPLFTGPSCLISKALHLYLTEERPKYALDAHIPRGERWLFPMPSPVLTAKRANDGATPQPINVKMLQKRAVKFRKPAGVKELHPHLCRSHYATALLSIPLDPLEVGSYLGHTKNLDTLANHYAGVRMQAVSEWMGQIARPTQEEYQKTYRQHHGRHDELSERRRQQQPPTS